MVHVSDAIGREAPLSRLSAAMFTSQASAIAMSMFILSIINYLIKHLLRNFTRQSENDIPVVQTVVDQWTFGSKTAFEFYTTRTPFLKDCTYRYGRAFKFRMGRKTMHIVSTMTASKTFYFNRELDHKEPHFRALVALGSSGDRNLLAIPVHKHFLPSFGRRMSRLEIAQGITAPLYIQLSQQFEHLSPNTHQLSEMIGRTLYDVLSRVVFGNSFPLNTYEDFVTLDDGFNMLAGPWPFVAYSAVRARERLLAVLTEYIKTQEEGKTETASIISSALKSVQSLPFREKAACLLSLFWSIHSNLRKSIWWMTAHLARDPEARCQIHDEISTTLQSFDQDFGSYLRKEPDSMFKEFSTVDSVVSETNRLFSLPGSFRVASVDTELQLDNGRTMKVPRGDMVMFDTRPYHLDDSVYPDATCFQADRFIEPKMDVPDIMSWGTGPHMCKGKVFAHHVMKVWAVALLERWDIETTDEIPELAPASANTIADPAQDILITLHIRPQA
ncbi:cytochrome P450 [Favolaschia claudopus]|uniref:Cytochrome P450 n=1 Tax=Favolaschia claudopus TaxID=2862362 RepID=A0AAW0A077_9AGAR